MGFMQIISIHFVHQNFMFYSTQVKIGILNYGTKLYFPAPTTFTEAKI